MTIRTLKATAFVALGFGLVLASAPGAGAQDASATQRIERTEGSHVTTRSRGHVGVYRGGPRYYGGGGRRHYGGYRRGGYVAGGVAAGIAGAIILNEIARSRPPQAYYYGGSPGLSCGQLEYRCDNGEDWACRRLDRDPRC